MKTVLVGLNAKHPHANLAIRLLTAAGRRQGLDVSFLDTHINRPKGDILADILSHTTPPAVVGFSCYIWNIALVRSLTADIRAVMPEMHIIWGGPEVSFDPETEWLQASHAPHAILAGECEDRFPAYLQALESGMLPEHMDIPGLYTQAHAKGMHAVHPAPDLTMHTTTFPLDLQPGQMAYFETSRGCPFSCTYCLSAPPVRTYPWDYIQTGLERLMAARVPTIKLVDRSFNAAPHTQRLLDFIIAQDTDTCFHLELEAHALSEAVLDTLCSAPTGRFQVEIGVQSTCKAALQAVGRPADFAPIRHAVERLQAAHNMHIHLDLIAGLPYEDYSTFARSFNDVYALHPQMLQLGFLKLLRGSKLRAQAAQYGIRYQADPPYEVLSTQWLGYADMQRLHGVEAMLERFGACRRTMDMLATRHGGAFQAFEALWVYWQAHDYHHKPPAHKALWDILHDFGADDAVLRWDYLTTGPQTVFPAWMDCPEANEPLRTKAQAWLAQSEWAHMSARQRDRVMRLAWFDGWWLFRYGGSGKMAVERVRVERIVMG